MHGSPRAEARKIFLSPLVSEGSVAAFSLERVTSPSPASVSLPFAQTKEGPIQSLEKAPGS